MKIGSQKLGHEYMLWWGWATSNFRLLKIRGQNKISKCLKGTSWDDQADVGSFVNGWLFLLSVNSHRQFWNDQTWCVKWSKVDLRRSWDLLCASTPEIWLDSSKYPNRWRSHKNMYTVSRFWYIQYPLLQGPSIFGIYVKFLLCGLLVYFLVWLNYHKSSYVRTMVYIGHLYTHHEAWNRFCLNMWATRKTTTLLLSIESWFLNIGILMSCFYKINPYITSRRILSPKVPFWSRKSFIHRNPVILRGASFRPPGMFI